MSNKIELVSVDASNVESGVSAKEVNLEQDLAPSAYGVFNVVYNGELVTCHYLGKKKQEGFIG